MSISDPMKRLQVIQTPALRGWTVEQTCLFYGVSPATFYVWQARFNEGGVEGLRERSRRPHTSPTQITGDGEDQIVAMRRTHPSWGAQRIRDELRLAGVSPPAVSTIHQVLVRHGLVEPVASQAKATGRFERPCPNDLWQIDATEWELADHTIAQIIDLIDDHSRFMPASRAWPGLSEDNAWDTLQGAIDEHGPPRQLLSDNARWLTGRPYQAVIEFERRCWRLHIDTIQARLYHPQTLGKLERQHRTLKDWLRGLPRAHTIAELQAQLDAYRLTYNHHRPHQQLDGTTPWARYQATAKAVPIGPSPTVENTRLVAANGAIRYSRWSIHIGRRWAGSVVTLIEHADKLRIIHADELIAIVILDPVLHPQRYISTGQPRGRPHNRA
jgi:transposase InsO family protein